MGQCPRWPIETPAREVSGGGFQKHRAPRRKGTGLRTDAVPKRVDEVASTEEGLRNLPESAMSPPSVWRHCAVLAAVEPRQRWRPEWRLSL
jgi:hypothetical protein